MATIWAIGELVDGAPTKLTFELATLARQLADASGGRAAAVLVGEGASTAGSDVADYVPSVYAVDTEEALNDRPIAAVVAPRVAALVAQRKPDFLLLGASNDGKDTAGMLVGLTDLPILYNGAAVEWAESAPRVEMSTFGGKLVTHSTFNGERGIVVVRAASVTAEPASSAGDVETTTLDPVQELPKVTVADSVMEAGAAAPIEEARIIVGGGRGVGSPDGFRMIEDLAQAMGGAVGATRAVVDAGWIGYSQQIGQTGKIVKPALYVACGISGAIQHKVGVQTAGTIIAINRDPDAPIAEFADLMVVGDVFEIVPRLTQAIKTRKSGS
ncbi:MAG TPA: electron transfer flavoprotein subunit alpha/FixB family protein [Candidatus Limnocylindrales bacterium]